MGQNEKWKVPKEGFVSGEVPIVYRRRTTQQQQADVPGRLAQPRLPSWQLVGKEEGVLDSWG